MTETRPTVITAALDTVAARLGLTISGALDTYIAGLESAQAAAKPVMTPAADMPVMPYWSHQRSVRAEQRRQLRAVKRETNAW